MPISTPPKMPVPWATSGLKNTIPPTSSPVTGNAGYDQGFTAINMTPRTAGGIPPFGQDFNGIFFAVTEALRYLETGAGFPYDGTFATAVGGYPLGARVQRTDGYGSWLNTTANNTADPEAFGAGWAPEGSGIASVAMSNANVTLTALQAARGIIVITGTLTANLNLVFPTYQKQWVVVNRATGAFTVTCKTAAGSGIVVRTSTSSDILGDGVNITYVGTPTIGEGQTWQSVTGSRSVGVTYVNTTASAICVHVAGGVSVASGNITITVSGVAQVGSSYPTAGLSSFVFTVIPPGGSYVVSGISSLSAWSELR